MRIKKHIVSIFIIILLILCVFPYPKKINNTFKTENQDGKKIAVKIEGTCYYYLLRKDKFNGKLIDENGVEYPSVKEQDISETLSGANNEIMVPVSFARLDENTLETTFVMTYFDEKLETLYYCSFMESGH